MSWDVILLQIPSDIMMINDLADDFVSVLGAQSEIVSKLTHLFPDLNCSDPAWGVLDRPGFSIEFNIGHEDPISSIMLHVRGEDAAVEVIHDLCQYVGWRAFDTTTGEFLAFGEHSTAGLRQWRAYRDSAIIGSA